MIPFVNKEHLRIGALMLCLLLSLGCIPKKETRAAEQASKEGRWDEAYELWSEALKTNPNDTRTKVHLERARLNAALNYLEKAQRYYRRGQYAEAKVALSLAMSFDSENQEGENLASRIKVAEEREERIARQEAAELKRKSTLPQLRPNTWAPQDLMFVNQSIQDIYSSLGQAYDVNIVVHNKLRKDKITVDLRRLDFLHALDTLMVINGHFFKVIDDNTVIILDDNKGNRDRYDNQIIQTFYLSNITPQDLKNHLRVLLGIKEYAENERLNAITIKGTPEQIALAEKMIASNDKPQAEVVVEIELLEVNKNTMRRVGLLPVNSADGSTSYRVGLLADPLNRSDDEEDANGLRGIFPSLNSSDILTILPAVAIDFLRESGGSTAMANPHLRVTSGEQGTIRIGQSIPIVQTSFTNAQISGSSSGGNNFGDQALTTFDYNDVGIRINMTPRVHYNGEVTLKVELEVSSVVSGGLQPILGRREVTTNLRLKDGETNVIAGLLTNDERKSLAGIAGLSRIPVLGKLFSNTEKVITQTDIIMTIRPVIVRGANITSNDRAPYELSTLRLSSLYGDAAEPIGTEAHVVQELPRKKTKTKTVTETETNSDHNDNGEQKERRQPFDPDGNNQIAPNEDYPDEVQEDGGEEEEEAAPSMLSFTPAHQEARQDEIVEFNLFIANVENLRRGEVTIEFDPRVLQIESVSPGNFTNSRGASPILTPAWNNDGGRVTMIISQRSGGETFSGTGIMAVIRGRAKTPGNSPFNFANVKLIDPDGNDIPFMGLDGGLEVSP